MITELAIHIASVHALRRRIKDDWIAFHPANGELREARQAAKMAAMGVRPGIPDLVVLSPDGKVHFCEFKSENGTLNKAQAEFQMWCIRANLPHSVVRSVDQALRLFKYWGCLRDPDVEEE